MLSRYDVLVEYECFLSPYIQELDDFVVSEKCTIILEFESGGMTSRKLPPVRQDLHTINKYNDTHLMCHNWLRRNY